MKTKVDLDINTDTLLSSVYDKTIRSIHDNELIQHTFSGKYELGTTIEQTETGKITLSFSYVHADVVETTKTLTIGGFSPKDLVDRDVLEIVVEKAILFAEGVKPWQEVFWSLSLEIKTRY